MSFQASLYLSDSFWRQVRTMRKDGHYEMREYNMDVLEDEQDSSARAEGRPFPIYPSRGGLKPNFLKDIIARFVLISTSYDV